MTVPDYGRELTFGYFLIPNAADPLLDAVREIEARGLDWIGVQDHPYQRRFVDTWMLLGAIAAATTPSGFLSRCGEPSAASSGCDGQSRR